MLIFTTVVLTLTFHTAHGTLNQPDKAPCDNFCTIVEVEDSRVKRYVKGCEVSQDRDTKKEADSFIGQRRKHARKMPSAGYSERRNQLLQAAGIVFKNKGFQAASINEIAAEAGTDRASVYYYYGGKEEIFLDLIRRVFQEMVLEAESIANSNEPATNRLRKLLEMLFDSYEKHYPYQYLYVQEDFSRVNVSENKDAKQVLELSDRFEEAVSIISRTGLESGEFEENIDPRLLTFAVLGAANWSHRWFKPGGRLAGTEIGKSFADIFIHGLNPDGRQPKEN